MKQFFFIFLLLVISSSIPIILSVASVTAPPEVDEPLSPVDANKAVLTGTTEPGAKIVVTGGMYEIAPVDADSQGKFAITVALSQETTNRFFIRAEVSGEEASETVEVVIEEGIQVTQEYEAQTGADHTAPDPAEITKTDVETAENTYTIEGTGEVGSHVYVNNVDSDEVVDEEGFFSVEVALSGSEEKDTFSISLRDDAGNMSSGVKVYVSSSSDEPGITESNDEVPSDLPRLTDITGHWAKSYIEELYEEGSISGYGDGRFGPDDPITRAQIVKIALLAFSYEWESTDESSFTDVHKQEWFFDYVNAASGNAKIVEGYSDKTFRPDNNVTRGEALKIIFWSGGLKDFEEDSELTFTDITSQDWFGPLANYAKSIGLIKGYGDGSFRGTQSITRGEVCKMVIELREYLSE